MPRSAPLQPPAWCARDRGDRTAAASEENGRAITGQNEPDLEAIGFAVGGAGFIEGCSRKGRAYRRAQASSSPTSRSGGAVGCEGTSGAVVVELLVGHCYEYGDRDGVETGLLEHRGKGAQSRKHGSVTGLPTRESGHSVELHRVQVPVVNLVRYSAGLIPRISAVSSWLEVTASSCAVDRPRRHLRPKGVLGFRRPIVEHRQVIQPGIRT